MKFNCSNAVNYKLNNWYIKIMSKQGGKARKKKEVIILPELITSTYQRYI